MVSKSSSSSAVRDRFPGGENMNLLFNSDKVKLLLKNNGGRDRKPNFVVFVVWRALNVDEMFYSKMRHSG